MADLYRLNNFNYTFTATDSSVLLSDAISAQCNAIIINASEPVFIKITKHGEDWPHYVRVSGGDRVAGLRAGSSNSVVYITELTE